MLKTIKVKSSIYLFLGLVFIIAGLFVSFFEYFELKKDKAFSKMNILLYKSEMPENIDEDSDNVVNEDNQEPSEPSQEEPKAEAPINNSDKKTQVNNYIGILKIPKINLNQGFYDLGSVNNNVDKNITVINGSTFPHTKNNNLILAAHSGNCWYCYFNQLYKLSVGDQAYLTYENETHTYEIVNIYEVEKTGTVAIYRDYNKSVLTLITCTRNSDTKQTVYILELQD